MDKTRLFWASSISMATTSIVFVVRGDVAEDMAHAFHLSHAQLGWLFSPAFWCFTLSIFACGVLMDRVGMRRLHILSAVAYLLGLAMIVLAPVPQAASASIFDAPGTCLLYAGFGVLGLAQGLVEGVTNPLIATLYPDQKVRQLNVLHAWYPGGLIIGGLAAAALTRAFDLAWQAKLALAGLPAIVYLLLALRLRYPAAQDAQVPASAPQMWQQALRPLFVVLFGCMWLTSAVELGPDQWFPAVMAALVPQMQGVLFLVYTASLMFVLRAFGGGLIDRAPIAGLLVCSALSAIGLYWLGSLKPGSASTLAAFAAATVFGIGRSFFWPTMLGVVGELFPRGGALLMCLMGGAGMASVAVVLPLMGQRMDHYGAGAALQMVAGLALVLVAVFAVLLACFRRGARYTRIAAAENVV